MGACFEVYKDKGSGFLEAVYQECLEIELATRKVHFKPQPQLALAYKGQPLKTKYIPDFLCRYPDCFAPDRRSALFALISFFV